MSLVHPLARVLGKGAAKSGVHHWWVQRVTAIALVPLTLWVIASLLGLKGGDHDDAVAWMSSPVNAALLISWVVVMLHHAQLGLQVVIEDYIHTPWMEMTAHLLVKFAMTLGMVVAAISILRVAL